jgi:son of sevenless-like protein
MASEIVLTRNVRNRAVLVKHLISTAEKCRLINNFNTLKSILAALNMSGIVRLKKTWELVPQKWKSVYLNLNELMSESKSYKAYRQALTCCEGSCIPFLGVYLSNLVFLEVGNRTYLDEEAGIINFDKQSRIAKIIEEVMTYQRSAYNFQPISQIQKAIQQAKILCEEEIYACSLEIEPRPSHLISPVSHYVPSTVSESQQ